MNLTELECSLQSMARNSIRLEFSGPASSAAGASHFGGVPDVPADFIWPTFETETFEDDEVKVRPLAFLAQFHCSELSFCDKDGLLPKSGLLSFFYELGSQRWGFDPADKGCARVFWFPDTAALAPAAVPADLPADYRLPAIGITPRAERSFPHPEDYFVSSVGETDHDSYWEAYHRLADIEDEDDSNRSCLLGWPNIIQGNMTCECQLVNWGHYLGHGWGDIPASDIKLAKDTSLDTWQLLFQLDTVTRGDFELMFGDCGRVYFYIRREDLLARRFDRVWLVLQCG